MFAHFGSCVRNTFLFIGKHYFLPRESPIHQIFFQRFLSHKFRPKRATLRVMAARNFRGNLFLNILLRVPRAEPPAQLAACVKR